MVVKSVVPRVWVAGLRIWVVGRSGVRIGQMGEIVVSDEINVFSDEQCSDAALMRSRGYPDVVIAQAIGVSESELVVLWNDVRVRGKLAEFAKGKVAEQVSISDTWDSVESNALGKLNAELSVGNHGLDTMELLAIAKAANSASRANSVKGGGGLAGVINPGEGLGEVVTLQIPQVVLTRLQLVVASGGEVLEGEYKEVSKIAEAGDMVPSHEDISKALGVNVSDPSEARRQASGVNVIDSVLETGLAVGIDEDGF